MFGGTYYRNNGLSAFGDLGAMSCAQRDAGIRRGRCQSRRTQWDAAVAAGCTPSRPRPSCPGGGMAGGGFSGVLSAIGDATASAKGFWSSLSLLQKAALLGGSGALIGFLKGRR